MGVIPNLITLGNAVCGFTAIYKITQGDLMQAAWLILLALVFDAFDGKVARLTKQTSDFGGQLDSLSDAVSFGLAPALLVATIMKDQSGTVFWSKATWFFCLVYALCAILRLARFNVEGRRGVKGADSFKGLPTPAAAGMIASLYILGSYVVDPREALRVGILPEETARQIQHLIEGVLIPASALPLGYLMVSSRVRYVHVFNRYVSGKRTFEYFATMIVVVLFAAIIREIALAVGFFVYVVSGPVGLLAREIRERRVSLEEAAIESPERPSDGT